MNGFTDTCARVLKHTRARNTSTHTQTRRHTDFEMHRLADTQAH